MQEIIVFMLVFFVVVTVHEFGHFLVAKKSGILCQEFAIGMGPKIFHKKIGETNFTIRLLPLGGYVKMPDNVFDFNNEVSPYDIEKGMQLYLKLDDEDKVEKIHLNKTNDVNLVQVEVSEFDLSDKLFIEGYINNGEELERFSVREDACVAFAGMEEQIAPIHRMFSSHSWFKKFATLFAGPLFNFILAVFIFVGLTINSGVATDKAILGSVSENSPAARAGLQSQDVVKSIDGVPVSTWRDLGNNIMKSEGKEMTFVIDRTGKEEILKITAQVDILKDSNGNEQKRYTIGIGPYYEKDLLQSIKVGLQQTLTYGSAIFIGIVGLLKSVFTGGFDINNLGGPVAIYEMTSQVSKSGIEPVLKWVGLLSVNLGLMNLIPIPVLDGGRIIFVIYEAIFGKQISPKIQYYVTAVFGVLLILLMLAVTWNDISRLFS